MRRAIALLALLAIAPALATTKPPPDDPEARAEAAAKAAAVSAALAASRSTSSSSSDSNASASNTATTGDSVSSTALQQTIEGNAPAAYAPDIAPTAPCLNGWSMGGSGMGGGLSFGKGREVPGCVSRELIRMAAEMGLHDRALFMWCNQAEALNVFGTVEQCMGFGAPAPASATADCSAVELERDRAEARFERAVEVCGQDKE